jgi:hypothetical protein
VEGEDKCCNDGMRLGVALGKLDCVPVSKLVGSTVGNPVAKLAGLAV